MKKNTTWRGMTMQELDELRRKNRAGQGNVYWRWHSKENKPRGLGAVIKAIRWDVLRMFQKDFGALFGPPVSQSGLSDIEAGKYLPSEHMLRKSLELLAEEIKKTTVSDNKTPRKLTKRKRRR